ncbi:MAG TPA: hypothetical protein PKE45_15260 [Caldilineaceae bacterium]|nr:hypothetical protein [Caldilineaceae bacterium]
MLLLAGSQPGVTGNEAVIQRLVDNRLPLANRQIIRPPDWPATLPAGSSVLLQVEDSALLSELKERYPGGQTTVVRDGHSNPVLYRYVLP